jgi:hypothetical protein
MWLPPYEQIWPEVYQLINNNIILPSTDINLSRTPDDKTCRGSADHVKLTQPGSTAGTSHCIAENKVSAKC